MDTFVQATNNSSIVSKRSVERLYFDVLDKTLNTDPGFFKAFVPKFKRRSPIINRGYLLRLLVFKYGLQNILANGNEVTVVNLGCGFDPIAFQVLQDYPNVKFIDIDYPDLITEKIKMIKSSKKIMKIIGKPFEIESDLLVALKTNNYQVVKCDLNYPDTYKNYIEGHLEIKTRKIFLAEVSITYMEPNLADFIIKISCGVPNSHFLILEQLIPYDDFNNKFVSTMIRHFNHINSPIKSVENKYHTVDQQQKRFSYLTDGKGRFELILLMDFWLNYVDEKQKIEEVEPFDEYEEFNLFCSHYYFGHYTNCSSPLFFQVKEHDDFDMYVSQLPKSKLKLLYRVHKKTNIMQRRLATACNLLPGKIIYNSGFSKTKLNSSVLISDQEVDQLLIKSSNISERLCHTITNIGNGKVMLIGGRLAPSRPLNDCWMLNQVNDHYEWTELTRLPDPRFRHTAFKYDNDSIIVVGGTLEKGKMFLRYSIEKQIWTQLSSDLPSTIGSAVCFDYNSKTGYLVGGKDNHDHIDEVLYSFKIQGSVVEVKKLLKSPLLARYSATLQLLDGNLLLLGGVSNDFVLNRETTIVAIKSGLEKVIIDPEVWEKFPLLVGGSAVVSSDQTELQYIGGGAVCFSFGSYWNEMLQISTKPSFTEFLSTRIEQPFRKTQDITVKKIGENLGISQITRMSFQDLTLTKWKEILHKNAPVVFENCDIGNSANSWKDPEYLVDKVGGTRQFTVHESQTKELNFSSKNFKYRQISFCEFISLVFNATETTKHKYYLRSLSNNAPTSKATVFQIDFPELTPDFILPGPFEPIYKENLFLSILRITSSKTSIWLHYDCTANLLTQVVGEKLVRVYPPSQINHLNFQGTTSTIPDIFSQNPKLAINQNPNLTPFETVLRPKDILFIPHMWLHATKTLLPSISVNCFWKDLPESLFENGKDVYGNKDLKVYSEGKAKLNQYLSVFDKQDKLPTHLKEFYFNKMIKELQDQFYETL